MVKNGAFSALYKTLIGIAYLAMPKISIYTSKQTQPSEQSEHQRQPAYLLTQRQAVTHQNRARVKIAPMHQQKAHQMHSTKATPEEPYKGR